MKLNFVRMGMLVAGLAGVFVLIAAEDPTPEYKGWMADAKAASGALKKGIDVPANAAKLADVSDKLAAWWKVKKADDAVKFSTDMKAGAMKVADATKAGNAEDVAAGNKMIGASCQGCHMAHREGSGGAFQIK